MGTIGAMGMKDAVDEGLTTLRDALVWHLRSNHFPPIPISMVDVAEQAINLANEGRWSKEVQLPEGIEHRTYGIRVPANVIIEQMHLDTFIDEDVDDTA